MHGLGTRILVELERNGDRQTIYEADPWSAHFRDMPPLKLFLPTDPLQLMPEDTLYLRCHYHNNTGRVVRFPEEMCVMVAYYYPASSEESGYPNGPVICG